MICAQRIRERSLGLLSKNIDRLNLNVLSQHCAWWDQRTTKELAAFVTTADPRGGDGIAEQTLEEGA